MKPILIAAAAALSAGPGLAAGLYDGAAIGTGQSQNEIVVLGENHVVMHSVGIYQPLATADANNPMTGLPGKCFGSIEMKGASASGSGHCVFAEGDSRAVVTDWTVTGRSAEGALTGQWSVIGAAGSATGLTGGGSFSNLTDRATGTFTNSISGAVSMP
jgi:hypothetical protein